MNLITISKNAKGISKFDYGSGLTYSFVKDYDKWIPISKKAPCAKMLMGGMQKSAQRVTIIDAHNIKKDTYTKEVLHIGELDTYLTKWNEKLPFKIRGLSKGRCARLAERLKEKDFVDNFGLILQKILDSDFLSGRKPSATHPNFKADFDWIIHNSDNYIKILEGKYDNQKQSLLDKYMSKK